MNEQYQFLPVSYHFSPFCSCLQNSSQKLDIPIKDILLTPERPHPRKPWSVEPGIDEPYIPDDPGDIPLDPEDEGEEDSQ